MSSKKVFFLMIGVLVLVSGCGVAAFVLGNEMLQKRSAKLVELKLQDQLLEEQQTALIKANADIQKYAELEKIAKTIVPQDKDQAAAVREIIQIARSAGISITQISFNTSNLGVQASTTKTSGGTTTSNTPTVSQAKPVDGLPGVYALEISIVPASAPYYQFLNFLSRLENNRRTAQVTNIEVTPRVESRRITNYDYKLTVNIFIKPQSGDKK